MAAPDRSGLILLIEDQQHIATLVGEHLVKQGFDVDYAADAASGMHLAAADDYDAIVLDLTLPDMDGLDVCRHLRSDAQRATPVLILTARDGLEDKIAGLDAGADDYVVKPFEMRELDARLRALIRRDHHRVSRHVYQVDDLVLDTGTMQLTRAGRRLSVPPIGMKILLILMRESPRLVSRREIEREIWGDHLPDSDTLRSHLYNLRRVVDKPFAKPLLHTIHAAGYRLADMSSAPPAKARTGDLNDSLARR